LSPVVHNNLFQRKAVNALYLPFRVPRGQLQDHLKAFDAVPVSGYSVTIPHKEGAAALAEKPDELVKQTKAANTLIRIPDGRFAAANTDYTAILDSLSDALAPNED